MTLHAPKLLTPEEFASLLEVAVSGPEQSASIPVSHLSRLVALGYVTLRDQRPIVTGDGLVRITSSE